MHEVLSAMGAEVWVSDPRGVPSKATAAPIERMVMECDAVSLHCDLNPSSEMILGQEQLQLAQPDLVIVNTARGRLVDAETAINMAMEGRLGAVAFDVFPVEPWPKMDVDHPRVMLTPHSAGFHTGLAEAVRNGLTTAVRAFVDGQPVPHLVESR
jgi:phosphoglycerate dehydrogenase-like enzyme